jgi:hypothetical protein
MPAGEHRPERYSDNRPQHNRGDQLPHRRLPYQHPDAHSRERQHEADRPPATRLTMVRTAVAWKRMSRLVTASGTIENAWSTGRTAMACMTDPSSASPNRSAIGPAQPKTAAPQIRLTSTVAVAAVVKCRSSIRGTETSVSITAFIGIASQKLMNTVTRRPRNRTRPARAAGPAPRKGQA